MMLVEHSGSIHVNNIMVRNVKAHKSNQVQRSLFSIKESKALIISNSHFKNVSFSMLRVLGILDTGLTNTTFLNCVCPLRIVTNYKLSVRILLLESHFLSCSCKLPGASLRITLMNNSGIYRRQKLRTKLHSSLSSNLQVVVIIKHSMFYNCHSELNGGGVAI